MMGTKGQLPPVGSEWFEDDTRVTVKTKITVVAHYSADKVVIARGSPPSTKYRTRARGDRFGKKRGYLPWNKRPGAV